MSTLLLLAVVLAGLAAVSRAMPRSQGAGGAPLAGSGISPIRARVGAILRDALPAAYPDERFARIVGRDFDPAASEATTCGALPGFVGVELGDPGGITHWGVPGVRDVAQAHNAWVTPGGGRAPKLGDVYLTAFPPGHPRAGQVSHTGIVVQVDGGHWTTADAGQGTRLSPRAEYVERIYDAAENRLRQASNPGSEGRTLLGWLDLDAYVRARGGWPFPSKQSLIDAGAVPWRFVDAPAWDPEERAGL